MSTIWGFGGLGNKHDVCGGKGCTKKFWKSMI